MFYTHVDFWVFHSQHHKLKQRQNYAALILVSISIFSYSVASPCKSSPRQLHTRSDWNLRRLFGHLQNWTTAHAQSDVIGLHGICTIERLMKSTQMPTLENSTCFVQTKIKLRLCVCVLQILNDRVIKCLQSSRDGGGCGLDFYLHLQLLGSLNTDSVCTDLDAWCSVSEGAFCMSGPSDGTGAGLTLGCLLWVPRSQLSVTKNWIARTNRKW
jgi:hypothetical protein